MLAVRWKLAIGLCGLVWGQCASAVIIGGFTFQDNAFADRLVGSTGDFTTVPTSGSDLEAVLTDTNENTGAFTTSTSATVLLRFTDNTVVNGSGTDLVLFELGPAPASGGAINTVAVAFDVGGALTSVKTYNFLATTTTDLNAAAINLDDFGIAANDAVSTVFIQLGIRNSDLIPPTLTLAGALNSGVAPIPVPAAVWMFGSGLIGLVGVTRRRRA